MSTAGRLSHLFGIGAFLQGQWLRLDLEPKPGMPVAWVLPADGDYGGPVVRTDVVVDPTFRDVPHAADGRRSTRFVSRSGYRGGVPYAQHRQRGP